MMFLVALVCSLGGFLAFMFALFACLIDGPLEDEQ